MREAFASGGCCVSGAATVVVFVAAAASDAHPFVAVAADYVAWNCALSPFPIQSYLLY